MSLFHLSFRAQQRIFMVGQDGRKEESMSSTERDQVRMHSDLNHVDMESEKITVLEE